MDHPARWRDRGNTSGIGNITVGCAIGHDRLATRIDVIGITRVATGKTSRASGQAQQKILHGLESKRAVRKSREIPVVAVPLDFHAKPQCVLAVRPGNIVGGFPIGLPFGLGKITERTNGK